MSAQAAHARDLSGREERLEHFRHWAKHVTAGLLVVAGIVVLVGSSMPSSAATRGDNALRVSSSGDLLGIEARLSELEAQNQRLTQGGALLLILVGVGVLVGRLLPVHTLEANRLVLRDGRGRLRVGLTPDAGLVILDRAQRPRVELSGIGEGASLKLFDATRQRRIELTELADGAVLAISDCSEHPRAALLGVGQDGPSLSLVDGKGAGALAIGSEGPNLVLMDREKGRGTLGVTEEGPELVFTDARGNPSVVLSDENRSQSIKTSTPLVGECRAGLEGASRKPRA